MTKTTSIAKWLESKGKTSEEAAKFLPALEVSMEMTPGQIMKLLAEKLDITYP